MFSISPITVATLKAKISELGDIEAKNIDSVCVGTANKPLTDDDKIHLKDNETLEVNICMKSTLKVKFVKK